MLPGTWNGEEMFQSPIYIISPHTSDMSTNNEQLTNILAQSSKKKMMYHGQYKSMRRKDGARKTSNKLPLDAKSLLAFIGIVTKNEGMECHLEPAYQVVWFRIQPRGNNISTTWMEERNEIHINSLAVLNELTTLGRALLAETSQKYSQKKTVNRLPEIFSGLLL